MRASWTHCQKCEHREWDRNQALQLVLLGGAGKCVVVRWARPTSVDLSHHKESHGLTSWLQGRVYLDSALIIVIGQGLVHH